MIQLLFAAIFCEMGSILVLLFKTPLRKLVVSGLDRVKRGRGPVVVKTVAGTVFAVMISSVYSMMKIQNRGVDDGDTSPTDQVLWANHLLEASLMGFSLFLALMIDRLHHYIRELRLRRKSMEAVKKQTQGFENGRTSCAGEISTLEEEVTRLRVSLTQLESELETKEKEVDAAEMNAVALEKQSEGFLLEYDRLFAENQNLRTQLQSFNPRLSRSGYKKNT